MTQFEFFKYLNSGITTLGIFTLHGLVFTKECEILDGDMYHIYRFNPQTSRWILTYSIDINQLDKVA